MTIDSDLTFSSSSNTAKLCIPWFSRPQQSTTYAVRRNSRGRETYTPITPEFSIELPAMGLFSRSSSRSSSSSRHVSSRSSTAAERQAILAFQRHADHCRQCRDPNHTARTGGQLCEEGHELAIDLSQHIWWRGRRQRYYARRSTVLRDDEDDMVATEVTFPPNCFAAESLLRAIDDQLIHVQRRRPPRSYDRNYLIGERIPPRRRVESRERAGPPPAPTSYRPRARRDREGPPPPPAPEAPPRMRPRYRSPAGRASSSRNSDLVRSSTLGREVRGSLSRAPTYRPPDD